MTICTIDCLIKDEMPEIDKNILRLFETGSRGDAFIIEGFNPKDYRQFVRRFKGYFRKNAPQEAGKIGAYDFPLMIEKNPVYLGLSLEEYAALFVYNLDLHSGGMDPMKALNAMKALRMLNKTYSQTQLIFAAPGANLQIRPIGKQLPKEYYTECTNHPLGNWCLFRRIEGSDLVYPDMSNIGDQKA